MPLPEEQEDPRSGHRGDAGRASEGVKAPGEIHQAWLRWQAQHGVKEAHGSDEGLSPLDTVELPRGGEPEAYLSRLGFPGEPPFTRGVYPTMYRDRAWTIRQYAGFATPSEANARYRKLLERGQTGLSIAFDLPTQMGFDSDHDLARGEVGRVGVAFDGLWDMEALMEGIPLDAVSTSMTINATAGVLVGAYAALAERRGILRSSLAGTVQNDVLKEYVSRGTYVFPVEASVRLAVDLMGYCLRELPRWNPISISGYHMREAGASAAQELGFTLSHALAYAEAASQAGIDLEVLLPRFSFFFGVHNDFLEEIAKFRAGRRLWNRLVRERLGIDAPLCGRLRTHAQTDGVTLTAQQPMNNCVRTTLQALAAVLGGTQSLHVNAFDEALGLPSEAGAELAIRTQQIIAHESGVTRSADPLGGSYAIEGLTDALEEEALSEIQAIDDSGGAVAAASEGYTARRIAESAYAAQMRMESGRDVVVGVNAYRTDRGPEPPTFRFDAQTESRQREALEEHRASRDGERACRALDTVEERAREGLGVTEAIVEAVSAEATMGEVTDRLRAVYGSHDAGEGATV